MKIGIDVRYLSHGLVGGIHTYLKNLIPALVEEGKDHQFYLYADTKKTFELNDLPTNVIVKLLPYKNVLYSIYNDFFMRYEMVRDQIDLAHFPASYGFGPNAKTKTVVTLQDEINIMPLLDIYRGHKKNISTMAMMSYIHFCTKYSLKRTNILITVSQYSKNQILRFSGMNPDSILVIPHACPNDIHRVEDEAILHDVRDRLNLSKKFILAEAFKNPAVLVKAYNLLPESVKENLEIVFFSRSPNVLPIVNEAVEMGFAQLLIRPPRRDLSALYSMALVFVFPSWIEGFGIPLLEAMTCGAPIIASNRGSIPEVVGDAGIIIDAEDEMTLAQNIRMLYESEGEQEYYRLLGFNRINEFSWSKISQQVINAYQKAIYT